MLRACKPLTHQGRAMRRGAKNREMVAWVGGREISWLQNRMGSERRCNCLLHKLEATISPPQQVGRYVLELPKGGRLVIRRLRQLHARTGSRADSCATAGAADVHWWGHVVPDAGCVSA